MYKSTQGLRQHETLRHSYYNTPSSNLLDLPQQHINEVKETL
ncbi:23499_t:CDS:1, partial [Gigaspora rosea]